MADGKAPSVKEATAGSTANKVLKGVAVALVGFTIIVMVLGALLVAFLNVGRVTDALTQKVTADDVAAFVETKYGGEAEVVQRGFPGIAEFSGEPVTLRRWDVTVRGSGAVGEEGFFAWSTRGDPFHPEEVLGDDAQAGAVSDALAAQLAEVAGVPGGALVACAAELGPDELYWRGEWDSYGSAALSGAARAVAFAEAFPEGGDALAFAGGQAFAADVAYRAGAWQPTDADVEALARAAAFANVALVGVADDFAYDAKALHVSPDSGDGHSLWVGGAVDVSKVERADVVDFGKVALSYPSQAEYAYGQGLAAFESAFEELEAPSVSEANPAGAGAWPPSAFEEGVCGPFRYRGDLSGGREVALRVPAAVAACWADAAGRNGAFGSVVVRVVGTAGVPEEASATMTAEPPASYEYTTDETPYNRAFKDAESVDVRDLVQPDGTILITLSEGADTFWVSGKPSWSATASQ